MEKKSDAEQKARRLFKSLQRKLGYNEIASIFDTEEPTEDPAADDFQAMCLGVKENAFTVKVLLRTYREKYTAEQTRQLLLSRGRLILSAVEYAALEVKLEAINMLGLSEKERDDLLHHFCAVLFFITQFQQ